MVSTKTLLLKHYYRCQGVRRFFLKSPHRAGPCTTRIWVCTTGWRLALYLCSPSPCLGVKGGCISCERSLMVKQSQKSSACWGRPCEECPAQVSRMVLRTSQKCLLCLLSRKLLCILFSYLPGNFALKMAGIFGDFFLVSASHETKHENSSKNSGKIRSKIGGKSGTKIRKNSGNFRSATFLT